MKEFPKKNDYETIRSLGSRGPFDLEVGWPKISRGIEQTVLLKRLRRGWQVHPDDVSAFVADSLALSGVMHPNLLEVIDAGSEAGRLYLVNEYIHGVTLSSILQRVKTVGSGLRPAMILEVILQVAGGLAGAAGIEGHESRGLVHGALGEEFVLLDFKGSVKIADFGVYRLIKTRQALGTLPANALSPEQRAGSPPTQRSDLYALGALAHKMISLLAVDDESAAGLAELRQVVTRLLKTDPEERPAGAEQVVEELSRLTTLSGESRDAALIGVFLRGLFGGITKREDQDLQTEMSPQAHGADEIDLLDPGRFWSATGRTDGEPQAPPEAAKDEDDVAEIVSPRPPKSPPPVLPRVSQALPAAISISVRNRRSKTSGRRGVFSYLIAVVVLALAALLAWRMLSGQGSTPPPSGPNQANGGQAGPPAPRGAAAATDGAPAASPESGIRKPGSLRITSDPSGVAVFINGEKHGATPTRVPDLQLNTALSVSLDMDGFRNWSQTVTLDRRNPSREIHAGMLEEKKCDHGSGWIYVNSKPSGATVEIDGKRLPGKTPLIIDRICAGEKHNVRVLLAGYGTWWKDVTPTSGRVLNLKVDLQK